MGFGPQEFGAYGSRDLGAAFWGLRFTRIRMVIALSQRNQ